MKYDNYYNMLLEENKKDKNNIRSDFSLILSLIKDFFLYLVFLIPNILLFLFSGIFGYKEKSKHYFQKIFYEPFKILNNIQKWFFEARITSSLILILILVYLIQVFFLGSYMTILMTHTLHIFEGNYISIITSIFLHGDLIHLGSNLIALLIFGRIVEKYFKSKTLWIFLLSGIIANVISNTISYLMGDYYYSLGASGAIAGLIMFAILVNPFVFTTIFLIPLPIFILGWFLIFTDIIGLTNPSQTNHLAHLGGYLALLIIFFFLEFSHRKKILKGFMINLTILLVFYLILQIFNFQFNLFV